jgi:hypothetical protein
MGGQEDDGTKRAERDIAEDIFMTPDLRPEALLALADKLVLAAFEEAEHLCSHGVAAIPEDTTPDKAAATLRALAAQPAWQAGFEEGRKRERAMWEMTRAGEAIEAALAAPSQPMAGEPLAALLRDCREREYNPFEPDNQSRLYRRIVAALAQHGDKP